MITIKSRRYPEEEPSREEPIPGETPEEIPPYEQPFSPEIPQEMPPDIEPIPNFPSEETGDERLEV
jgi:hypothetical protein